MDTNKSVDDSAKDVVKEHLCTFCKNPCDTGYAHDECMRVGFGSSKPMVAEANECTTDAPYEMQWCDKCCTRSKCPNINYLCLNCIKAKAEKAACLPFAIISTGVIPEIIYPMKPYPYEFCSTCWKAGQYIGNVDCDRCRDFMENDAQVDESAKGELSRE